MPKHDHTLTTSGQCAAFPTRRAMLASPVPRWLAPPPPARRRPDTDGAVIGLCAKLDPLTRQITALFEGPGMIRDDAERDEALRPIRAASGRLLVRICAARCGSPAAIIAKARSLALMADDMGTPPDPDEISTDGLLASLLRDAARGGV